MAQSEDRVDQLFLIAEKLAKDTLELHVGHRSYAEKKHSHATELLRLRHETMHCDRKLQ